MEQLIIAVAVFGFILFGLLGIGGGPSAGEVAQDRVMRALGRLGSDDQAEEVPSLRERVLRPLFHGLAAGLSKVAPKGQRNRTAELLQAAGLAGQWDSVEWKGVQFGLGALLSLILVGMVMLMQLAAIWRIEATAAGFLIGYLFPGSWLKGRIKQRRLQIETGLPDVLDLLTVSVEAGLGFDAALMKVVEKQRGVLAEEFLKVLQEIKMGRPRRDALRDLGKRNQVEDLSNVVASLVQADQLGIAIGGVLRNQSRQSRAKQRQRAEEKAQKAPVKIMIPLVFFVFPSVFIVILGPAAIQMIQMWSNK